MTYMKIAMVLLFLFIFAPLEFSAAINECNYEVKTFKGITAVRSEGNIPYLIEHPDANTEEFSKEKRLELCREGFEHVKRHEKGKNFIHLESDETEELKAYVLVNPPISAGTSGDIVEVRPAYGCPTDPPTYIHFNRDHQDTIIFWVIFKDQSPIFTFTKIMNYELHLVKEIREANVDEMVQTQTKYIINSYYDTDIITEEQRLSMCSRGMSIAPEIGVSENKSTTWGTSKYYAMWEPTPENENEEVSSTECMYLQAFSCPTTPEMYIQVQAFDENELMFWAYVKKSEIKQLPALNIMSYELLIVNSITVEGVPTRNDNGTQMPEPTDSHPEEGNKSNTVTPWQRKIDETKELINMASFMISNVNLSRNDFLPYLDKFNQLQREDAAMDTNKLKVEERLYVCAKAFSTVFGQSAKFTADVTGQSLYYRYLKDQTNQYYFINQRVLQHNKVVEAFQCATVPTIYLHIIEPIVSSQYVAHVIVTKKDLALLPAIQ